MAGPDLVKLKAVAPVAASAKQGGHNGKHYVGSPPPLREHQRKAARSTTGQMDNSFGSARLLRYPQRRSPDKRLAVVDLPRLLAVSGAAVAIRHLPFGIVRGGSDDAHIVTALHQPMHHLAGVLPDACQLGSEIGAVEQEFHLESSGKDERSCPNES